MSKRKLNNVQKEDEKAKLLKLDDKNQRTNRVEGNQTSNTNAVVTGKSSQKTITSLPNELVFHLFSFLDCDSLIAMCRVSKNLQRVASDNEFWKPRFLAATLVPWHERHHFAKSLTQLGGNWKKLYLQELLHVGDMQSNDVLARDVVVGCSYKGFHLTPMDEFRFVTELKSMGIQAARDCPLGHLPSSCRALNWLVNEIRLNQDAYRLDDYSDLQIVRVPGSIEWDIKRHSTYGYEWVEQRHRIWKADRVDYDLKRLHKEANARKRHIVVDIGPKDGLNLEKLAWLRLRELTGCNDIRHLYLIPRDHPALLQLYHELHEFSATEYSTDKRNFLRVISVPIEISWFVASKHGIEHVCESYSRWPEPRAEELEDMPFVRVERNKLISNMMSVAEWNQKVLEIAILKNVEKDAEEQERYESESSECAATFNYKNSNSSFSDLESSFDSESAVESDWEQITKELETSWS